MMTRWTNFRRAWARLLWRGIASVSDNAVVQNCYSFRPPAGNIHDYLEYPKHQQWSRATQAILKTSPSFKNIPARDTK